MAVDTKKLVADDVQVLVPGTGHWLAGRPPEAMLTALTAFLTPHRNGRAVADNGAARRRGLTRSGAGCDWA